MTETSLHILLKEIGEALKLDDDGKEKDAYKKYVECTHQIVTNLVVAMQSFGGNVIVTTKTCKQVKLVQQCIDRILALIEKMDVVSLGATTPTAPVIPSHRSPPVAAVKPFTPSASVSSSSKVAHQISPPAPPSVPPPSHTHPPAFQPYTSHPPSGHIHPPPINIPSGLGHPVPALPDEYNPYSITATKSRILTPIEVAQRQNASLLAAYRARMTRRNRADFNAFSYSLSIQRKMAENLAIAKGQQEELAKKIQARNKRFEEEAAKRFTQVSTTGTSKQEQEHREIYKTILEYENEAPRLLRWRARLEASPEDVITINTLMVEVLRCADHPLTQILRKYQFRVYEKLYPLLHNKHGHLDLIKVPLPEDQWPPSLSRSHHDNTTDVEGEGLREGCVQRSRSAHVPDEPNHSPRDEDIIADDSVDDRVDNDIVTSHNEKRTTIDVEGESEQDNTSQTHLAVNNNVNDDDDDGNDNNVNDNDENDNVDESESLLEEDANISKGPNKDDEHLNDLEVTAIDTARTLQLALDKGRDLTSVLSWETTQAQILMQHVAQDAAAYSQDNFDDLFDNDEDSSDDDDGDDGEDSCHANDGGESACGDGGTEREGRDTMEGRDGDREKRPQDLEDFTSRMRSHSSLSLDATFATSQVEQDGIKGPSGGGCNHGNHEDRGPESGGGKHDNTDSAHDGFTFGQASMEAYRRHLTAVCDDVHNYLDDLLTLMTLTYAPLDTPVGRDQCSVSLEEPFYKPLWKHLLRMFRVVNQQEERALAAVMTRYRHVTPRDLKVAPRFTLDGGQSRGQPYQKAIDELRRVPDHYTALNKLECVVKVCRLVCECVDEHYSGGSQGQGQSSGKTPSLGADDLLPVMTYILVHSGRPQLVAECHAMGEFINEGYMMGEEGYCLTTLRTALGFTSSLLKRPLSPS